MNDKLKPAIIGGVVLGLLSAIPFVNWVNICCCLWAILGGLLAAKMYVSSSPTPASAGDGAIVGALAGVVGGIIFIVVGIPLGILTSSVVLGIVSGLIEGMNPDQAELMRRQMEVGPSMVAEIFKGIILALLLVVFSTLGGLIGISIFEKRKGGTVPPPPQDFGGGQGSYGAA